MPDTEAKSREFLKVIEDNSGIINKICYYYAGNLNEYDDLRQEALICLWQGWDNYRGEASLSTWIYRVCLNSCVSAFRSSSRRGDSVPLDSLHNLQADDSDRPDQLRQMHALISRLSPREKAVILLWLDNYPYDSIAETMGVPRNTVASWIKRIKEKLVRLSNS